jgi:hypothetical protein
MTDSAETCRWCSGSKVRTVTHLGTSDVHGMRCPCAVTDLPVAFQFQEDPCGCALAAVAMAVNRPYAELRKLLCMQVDLTREGMDEYRCEDLLAHLGYAWQSRGKTDNRLGTKRDPWPCSPWTDTAIAYVRNLSGTGPHMVTLLRDGRVLDPWWGVIQGLHRYPAVHQIWGLYRVAGDA